MHTQELCLKHAMGLVERRRGGQVVDSFLPGKKLRDQAKKFAAMIMDKQVKKRFKEYSSLSKSTWNVDALKLVVPNETRVAGCYALFLSLLRAKPLIQLMASSSCFDFCESVTFTNEKWKVLAEFESIMKSMQILSLQTQMDKIGELCFLWYDVYLAKYRIVMPSMQYDVIDTSRSTWNPTSDKENIPRIRLTRSQLHGDAQEFMKRLETEFDRYFPKPDTDCQVAMKLHPLMVLWGFETLDILEDKNCSKEGLQVIDQNVFSSFTLSIFERGIPEILKKEKELREKEFLESEKETSTLLNREESDEEDVLKQLLRQERIRREKGNTREQRTSEVIKKDISDSIRVELEEYTNYCATMDVTEQLLLCSHPKYKNEKELDEKKIKNKDIMYVRERFDLLQWWRIVGFIKFPKLAVAALIILGKPSHNAFQERVFSLGNWTDSKLRKKRKEENFEINLLEACNAEFFNEHEIIEGKYLKDKQITTKTVKEFFAKQEIDVILEEDHMSVFEDEDSSHELETDENCSMNDLTLDWSLDDDEENNP
jgi:hypothetical protein